MNLRGGARLLIGTVRASDDVAPWGEYAQVCSLVAPCLAVESALAGLSDGLSGWLLE